MSIIGALVAYKRRPAKVVSSTTHKYEISFSDGSKQKVREKDFRFIHPEFSPVHSNCPEVDTSILDDLDVDSLSLKELTEWLFDDFTGQNAWFVYLMSEDGLYFYWNKNVLALRPLDQIQAIRLSRQEKALEEESLQRCVEHLKKDSFENSDISWIHEIEQVALNKSKHSKAMSALSIENTPENAHRLLIKIKYWSEFNNPYPQRNKIYQDEDIEFNESIKDRKDLTHLTCFAIDNSDSSDADDAISVEGDSVWIHIADVASFVDMNSDLDLFAQKRASNLYLPDQILHMLPPKISEVCSLGAHQISNAVSVGFLMNDSEITDIEIHLSQIRVTKMSYEEADKSLHENIYLSKLNEIAKEHKKFRDSRGALRLDLPKTDIKVKDQRVIVSSQIESESRDMVSEMMVLAGRVIAQYSIENNISMPYLSQASGKFSDEIIENIHNLSLSKAFEAAKGFSRSKLSVKSSIHAGLGLEAYIRVTSPMRRYLDLIVQHQLVNYISGLELLSEDDIKSRIKVNNASMSKINKAIRQSAEHFRCLYFKQNRSWEGEGVVIEISGNKTLLMIPEFAMVTQVKVKTKPKLEDKINLKLSSIDLFERLVDFKPL
ncbi:ribonuclease catalytic domain-containing protein [Candidatus Thioglobus sp.]|nr:ribonuclease catalytic domain-containing protein [Candidatus Thioglobus sp.]